MAKQLTKKAMLELLDKRILERIKNMEALKAGIPTNMSKPSREIWRIKETMAYCVLDCLRDELMGEAK